MPRSPFLSRSPSGYPAWTVLGAGWRAQRRSITSIPNTNAAAKVQKAARITPSHSLRYQLMGILGAKATHNDPPAIARKRIAVRIHAAMNTGRRFIFFGCQPPSLTVVAKNFHVNKNLWLQPYYCKELDFNHFWALGRSLLSETCEKLQEFSIAELYISSFAA